MVDAIRRNVPGNQIIWGGGVYGFVGAYDRGYEWQFSVSFMWHGVCVN